MKCECCGGESDGTYSEGGHKWHVCAQCYGEYVERYSASEGQGRESSSAQERGSAGQGGR